MDPYKTTKAWMCPDGSGWMFCPEVEGYVPAVLEVLIDASSDSWDIVGIRLLDPTGKLPKRILFGQNRKSAYDYLIDHEIDEINDFVAEYKRGMDSDDDGDQRCDERREDAA